MGRDNGGMNAAQRWESELDRRSARARPRLREDRVGMAGVALLAILTLGVVQLYRSAPQTLAEAGTRSLLVARPHAFAPRVARTEDLLRIAETHAASGEDSLAIGSFLAAQDQAVRALQAAEGETERRQAVDLVASSMLGRSRVVGRAASERGLRPDDRAALAAAILVVDSALALAPSAPVRDAGQRLGAELRRERRIGPLEWLPGRR